jgi:hypothetical protein
MNLITIKGEINSHSNLKNANEHKITLTCKLIKRDRIGSFHVFLNMYITIKTSVMEFYNNITYC